MATTNVLPQSTRRNSAARNGRRNGTARNGSAPKPSRQSVDLLDSMPRLADPADAGTDRDWWVATRAWETRQVMPCDRHATARMRAYMQFNCQRPVRSVDADPTFAVLIARSKAMLPLLIERLSGADVIGLAHLARLLAASPDTSDASDASAPDPAADAAAPRRGDDALPADVEASISALISHIRS